MCFYVPYYATRPAALIAEEDIVCYKQLDVSHFGLVSAVRGFSYEIGKTYTKTRFPSRTRKEQLTYEGFHSFIDERKHNSAVCSVECIIPKGAKYYKNNTEYCSSAIKIVKILRIHGVAKRIKLCKKKQKDYQRRALQLATFAAVEDKKGLMLEKFKSLITKR